MKNILTKIVFALIAIACPLFACGIKACVCLPESTPYKAYEQAKAVFVGKVVSSRDVSYDEKIGDKVYSASERHFLFAVAESFKGVKTPEFEISAGRIDSDCYAGFTIGESYIVYAYGNAGAVLYSGTCTRTNTLARAQDDLYFIHALLKGLPEPRVYGSVSLIDNDLINSHSFLATPLAGIRVIVEGAERHFEAVTDEQGLFSIARVLDGKYKARPVLPDNYRSVWPAEVEFTLGPMQEDYKPFTQIGKSAYAKFNVEWNNRIGGRLLDAEGNPIKRAKAALLSARNSADTPLVIEEDEYDLHEDGKYEFRGLSPGKYLLSLTISAPFKTNEAATHFYFPGITNLKQAGEIVIREHESLTDRDIKLPPAYLVRPIEGVIVWSNGSPVTDSWATLSSAESEDDRNNYDIANADKQGHFTLQAFIGAEYWVHASINTSALKSAAGKGVGDNGVQWLYAKPIKITVGKVNGPLRLVIERPEGISNHK